MIYPFIGDAAALTSFGDWPATWGALLEGTIAWTDSATLPGQEAISTRVAAVLDLDRSPAPNGQGPTARLLAALLSEWGDLGCFRLYAGSNHSEAELVRMLLGEPTQAQCQALLHDRIFPDAHGRLQRTYAACASGLHAVVAAAFDMAEDGGEDALVLAVDALSIIETVGFARSGALSCECARPFAFDRDGLTIGEGAAAVRLSASPSLQGVRILGVGMSCDAYHPTDPDPSGRPLERAIAMAIRDAGLAAADITGLVAHGTGTPKGDDAEAGAILRVWPNRPPAVTSVKGRLGHLMGAAGVLNLMVAREICLTGLVPPTLLAPADTLLDTAIVTGTPRSIPAGQPTICLASGFGGNNVAVIVAVP